MKRTHKYLALGMLCAVGACSSVPDAKEIGALQNSLIAAERLALVYTSLPVCSVPAPPPAVRGYVCADPTIKTKIKAMDNVAFNQVEAAKQNPSASLIGQAQGTLSAYLSLIPVAPVGP